jgi:pimeloyl-ACP methyl ester carboxylesterase
VFLKVRDRLVNTYSFGQGAPALIAHGGFTGSSELWLQPFEALSRHWQVATYDHRGSGENPAQPGEITREEMVADLFGVMDALGLRQAVVAGESMGAAIVLQAALEHPERFLGLVLIDGSPTWERDRSEGFATGLRSNFDATISDFVDSCINEPAKEHIRRWALDILRRATPEASAALVEAMWGLNLVDRLKELTLPALVIHGQDDAMVPLAAGQLMASQLSGSRLVVIEGCGHVPTMTFPDRVVEEVSAFLTSLGQAA